MIVSLGRGYVFVHIPKTGGTAMALALESRAMKDDIMAGDTPKALKRRRHLASMPSRGRLWKHSTLRDIDGLVSLDDLSEFFAFTLVRNPWDRMVSYYHWLRDQSFDHQAVTLSKSHDFDGFVRHPAIQKAFRANPPSAYMRRADGAEQCQAYIRLEHFDIDAEPLWAHLGFRLDLPQINQSNRMPDYRSVYSDETVDIIAGMCTEEIARFGYRFD